MKRPVLRKRKLSKPVVKPNASAADESHKDERFPVVGIGASAGEPRAFSSLLAHLPGQTGMAFVFRAASWTPVIPALSQEILSRATKIPMTEVTDGVVVERNHVYIIPANADMVIKDGTLRLSTRALARGLYRPVDHFLRSLAEEQGQPSHCGDFVRHCLGWHRRVRRD